MINEATIARLLNKTQDSHKATAAGWNQSMLNGDACYGRPIGFDTRRIYLNAMAKIWHLLKPNYSNLYEATIQVIESHRPEQFSSKKHCKEAAISFTKYLIKMKLITTSLLVKLKQIKIKRSKEPFRPTHRERDLYQWLVVNQGLQTSQASKDLNAIVLQFAFYTGLRISEICNLKLEHVFLDDDKILVMHGKGGKNRWVGINKALKADLIDYMQNKRGKTYDQRD